MIHTNRRNGFSLVELLTVIAIIAILAAIIFPVMSAVKERARQNNCMANLQQIGVAMGMFKQDNRKYPTMLSAEIQNTSDITPIDQASGECLLKEYVKSAKMMHCPSSTVTDVTAYGNISVPVYASANTVTKSTYAYDSYDFAVNTYQMSGKQYTNIEQHYTTDWAADDETATINAYNSNSTLARTDESLIQSDFERQLKFRNPPGDTLVTWCSYHSGDALCVFLDGHAEKIKADIVADCRWRTRPKP